MDATRFPPRCWLVMLLAVGLSGLARAEAPLPLERVVLFTSGVGSFQHGGVVHDDATIEMQFSAHEINDLLKSMVVLDPNGTAPSVTYASRDPVTKTLGTFAVNLTDNPSMGTLLGRLRGQKVELDAASPVAGTIVGVETRRVEVGEDQAVEREFLTLLTGEGLRTLALDSITRIRLVDQRMQGELEKALAVLALATDNEKKAVAITFHGAGERAVKVAYVQEAPVWKTSYRLVLDDKAPKARLQGWAIVENTSDADWNDVRVSLVSGRPISFVMDLYQPLTVPRPVVMPDLYASLMPQRYGQDMSERSRLAESLDGDEVAGRPRRQMARSAGGVPAAPAAEPPATASALGRGANDFKSDGVSREAAKDLQAVATGADLGQMFRFDLDAPVTLERQRSAMLPIVSADVEIERVAIYNERVLAKHPLSGLRVTNTTEVDLMQGPVTVYDAGSYAGDARIDDTAPGAERLLSYAVDLDVEVAPRAEGRPEEIVNVRLAKGVVTVSRKLSRTKFFEVKNGGDGTATVLIEHPLDQGWALVAPEKPTEKTRDRYRFAVTAEPGKTSTLEVSEAMPVVEVHALSNLDDGRIVFYMKATSTSPAVRDALENVIRRKREIEEIVQGRQVKEQEIGTIDQEQARIRGNMQALDRTSDLYSQYVRKFAEQEKRIETLRGEIAGLLAKEKEARASLDEYLGSLDVK